MCSSAILRDHDFHRDCRITFTLFQSLRLVVDHIDDSPSFPPQKYQTHQDATSHTTDKHPARFTSVTAARAREDREMYSVSIVSFGAELGRPSMRLMFNSSHNITKRFQSRRFVIKSAGLTVPRIFSILGSWFFSFCWSQKYFVSICLIAPLPLRRASPRAVAASVQIRT